MMPRSQRAYVIAMCAIIGGAFAYAACDWGRWPRLLYLPLTQRVTFEAGSTSLSVIYYGTVAWGIGGALCGSLVGAMLTRIVPRPWPDRAIHLFGAWALTAIVLAGGYYTWSLWPWSS
ncbi:MAG: hypothetical protein H6Q90_2058 [Deltaproteobacteria bacterium]|nr:hypothetical protein [Deltaproteobacteria bacterium]